MSLKPIDLQNLFVRLNEVSKQQAAHQEAQVHNQQVVGEEIERRTRLNDERVAQAEQSGEGPEKLNDQQQSGGSGQEGSKKKKKPEQQDDQTSSDEANDDVFRDPDLGNRIDISG